MFSKPETHPLKFLEMTSSVLLLATPGWANGSGMRSSMTGQHSKNENLEIFQTETNQRLVLRQFEQGETFELLQLVQFYDLRDKMNLLIKLIRKARMISYHRGL